MDRKLLIIMMVLSIPVIGSVSRYRFIKSDSTIDPNQLVRAIDDIYTRFTEKPLMLSAVPKTTDIMEQGRFAFDKSAIKGYVLINGTTYGIMLANGALATGENLTVNAFNFTTGAGVNQTLSTGTVTQLRIVGGTAVPTTGFVAGTIFYETDTFILWMATETVTGAQSWARACKPGD